MYRIDSHVLKTAPASPYGQALRRGVRALRFEPQMEADFREFHTRVHLTRIRLAGWLAALLFAAFAVIDVLTLPAAVWQVTAPMRLGLVVPACLLVVWACRTPAWHVRLPWVVAASCFVSAQAVVAVIAVGLWRGNGLPYEGILLVPLYIHLVACVLWWRALALGIATFATGTLTMLLLQPDAVQQVYAIAFMATATLVGACGGYVMEAGTRSTYLVQALLNELAERDGLTGLYNRRTFDARVGEIWRQARRERRAICIAMVDVDHFKCFNDVAGHGAGDLALQAVAGVIAGQARRPLDLAARYGGEEFVLAWYDADRVDPAALGEAVRAGVNALQMAHPGQVQGAVSVSVGIASAYPADDAGVADLLQAADAALYRAKAEGRNRVVAAA